MTLERAFQELIWAKEEHRFHFSDQWDDMHPPQVLGEAWLPWVTSDFEVSFIGKERPWMTRPGSAICEISGTVTCQLPENNTSCLSGGTEVWGPTNSLPHFSSLWGHSFYFSFCNLKSRAGWKKKSKPHDPASWIPSWNFILSSLQALVLKLFRQWPWCPENQGEN